MNVEWHHAPNNGRFAIYADHVGMRLFVERTPRAPREYRARLNGLRVGEYPDAEIAKAAAILAAQTKTAPQGSAGPVGVSFDY